MSPPLCNAGNVPTEMEIQAALEDRMAELLRYANYQHVADALGIKRQQVWRWAHGQKVTASAVQRVQAVMRPDLPETGKEAAPLVTRRLLTGVIALERKAGVSPDELVNAEQSAVEIEAALEADARFAAELEASQRKSSAQAKGRAGGRAGGSQGNTPQSPK